VRKAGTKTTATVTKTPTAGGKTSTAASSKRSSPASPATSTKTKAGKPRTTSAQSLMPTTKPQLSAWLKDASRTGSELAAAAEKFPETDRLIAANTSALPRTLSKLSHSSDKATRAKVAANPNTPPTDYLRLGQQFPNEFLANPALELLLLANPAFFQDWVTSLGPKALVGMVMQTDCPKVILEHVASLPTEWFEDADEGPEVWGLVKWAVALKDDLPSSVVDLLRGDPAPALPASSVGKRKLSVEAFKSWIWSLDGYSRTELAALGDATQEKLAHLQMSDPFLNPIEDGATYGLEPEDANRYFVLGFLGIAEGVARSPNTPAELLQAFAQDNCIDVRRGVAQNKNSPAPVLEMLAQDRAWVVRNAVAFNPNTPSKVLEFLAGDKRKDVRRMVAENLHTPVGVLETLAQDAAKDVRMAVADNPHTPSHVLMILGRDKVSVVRNAVARNLMAPMSLLTALALDKDKVVRIGLVENPRISSTLFERLASDKDAWVRLAAEDQRVERGEERRLDQQGSVSDTCRRDYSGWRYDFYRGKRRPTSRDYRAYILRSWRLTPDLLRELASDADKEIADAARVQLARLA